MDPGISRTRPSPQDRTSPVLPVSSPVPQSLRPQSTMPKPSAKRSKNKRDDRSDSENSDDECLHFFVPGEKIDGEVLASFLFNYIDKTPRIRTCQHPTVRHSSRIPYFCSSFLGQKPDGLQCHRPEGPEYREILPVPANALHSHTCLDQPP